jgi:tetratricopeptide (TPR) repeat protein
MSPRHDSRKSVEPLPLSRRRIIAFRLVCVSLPFLVLGLLEGTLRLAGMGGYAPIIRPVGPTEHGTLVITDPAGAVTWFFANRKRPGFNEQYSFYEPKPASTVRIVLVGESAMKGFPEPRHLAASAFFREMLRDVWPDRNVEVINLGTTAVASFPVLGIMTEALEYEPDLVIVSTGHNEFFGTYGVASTGRAGSRPWMLRVTRFVHSLAMVQGLEKVTPGRGPEENKTLMQMMMGRSYVGPDEWRRRAAAHNLEHNVAAMVDRCKARGVPIIVCTQPSNERDLAPLGSDKAEHLDTARRAEFDRLLASGMTGLLTNPTNALESLSAALAINPNHAGGQFYAGKALSALGRFADAGKHFIRARDLDTKPWRTPSSSQQAIVRAATQHGALICDMERAFRAASPGGAIGWELMDDHVHPTLAGQALVARTWVESLTHIEGRLHVSPEAFARLASLRDYERRLGENPFDTYGVAHTMRVIFDIPFMRETNPKAFTRFDTRATSIEANYSPEIRAVMREWQTANPHAGAKRPLTGMVARVFMRQGKFTEALDMLRIAQRDVPDYTSWHMEYVYFMLACQEKLQGSLSDEDKALALEEIKQGRFLLQHGYSEFGLAERYLGRLHQLRGEFAEAIPYLLASRKKLNGTDLVAADEALVVSYLKTGRPDEARRIVDNGIAHSGSYAGLYRRMLAELSALQQTNQYSHGATSAR